MISLFFKILKDRSMGDQMAEQVTQDLKVPVQSPLDPMDFVSEYTAYFF